MGETLDFYSNLCRLEHRVSMVCFDNLWIGIAAFTSSNYFIEKCLYRKVATSAYMKSSGGFELVVSLMVSKP
jgi:hypothetical protein